jgi:DNA-binding SARP family transcriptional activator
VKVHVLGTIEASVGDRALSLTSRKRRALLALLALHAGETMTADRIVDELWGPEAPASAGHVLQVHVSQLRKELRAAGCAEAVVNRPSGYTLSVRSDSVDAHRFERLLADAHASARDGRPSDAADGLRCALALWRGRALDGIELEGDTRLEAARLEERRLEALEARIDADLALGRHRALVAELERLVAREPLRERFRAQLMFALYRSGRQADALGVYRDTRATLVESAGIEPGLELRRLEQAILAQDPCLELDDVVPMLVGRFHAPLRIVAGD